MIGSVPSPTAVGTYIAIDKGYFRDAGIDVDLEPAQSAGAVMPLLASNRIQVVEGGMAASYWNALGQGMPVTIAMERGTTPLNHTLLVRTELRDKIKTVADLKGHSFAEVSADGIQQYEAGKAIAPAGLHMKDLDIHYIPYSQLFVAFTNGAVDAGMSIPPFSDAIIDRKLGFAAGRYRQDGEADADGQCRLYDQHRLGEEGTRRSRIMFSSRWRAARATIARPITAAPIANT